MSDIDRLPFNAARAFQQLNSASQAVEIMSRFYNPDWHCVYAQFLGDALPGEWAAADTNGTGATVTVSGGNLVLTTGTTDNGHAAQPFGLFWTGDAGIYMESAQTPVSAITTLKFEVGLTDALDDTGAVNVKATPSATADDFCVAIFDTDDNTQLDIISQTDGAGVAAAAENIHTVAADTAFTTIFRAQNDLASVAIGSGSGNIAVVNAAPGFQGGDSVTPIWMAQARAGTASRVVNVHYAFVMGPTS